MGWSLIGADEMARMRTYKANGGSIKDYFRKLRSARKIEERIINLDKKIVNRAKGFYNTTNPDTMVNLPLTSKTNGRWLKDMLKSSMF